MSGSSRSASLTQSLAFSSCAAWFTTFCVMTMCLKLYVSVLVIDDEAHVRLRRVCERRICTTGGGRRLSMRGLTLPTQTR